MRTYKVASLLSPKDRMKFCRLLDDPRISVDDAHGWMQELGHRISRAAVGRYVHDYRQRRPLRMFSGPGDANVRQLRKRLAGLAEEMDREELAHLVSYAEFLHGLGGGRAEVAGNAKAGA